MSNETSGQPSAAAGVASLEDAAAVKDLISLAEMAKAMLMLSATMGTMRTSLMAEGFSRGEAFLIIKDWFLQQTTRPKGGVDVLVGGTR